MPEQYMNNDERLGPSVKFTIPEMIRIYKDNQWCDGLETDQDIIDDILAHDVVEIDTEKQVRVDTYEARIKLVGIINTDGIDEDVKSKLDSICQELLTLDTDDDSEFDILYDPISGSEENELFSND